MSSNSDSDSEDIPDVAECQRLCEKFAEITGTDEACAQFYLQDRKWDLDHSVNDFFEDVNNKGAVRVNAKKEAQVVLVVDGSRESLAAAATAVLAEAAFHPKEAPHPRGVICPRETPHPNKVNHPKEAPHPKEVIHLKEDPHPEERKPSSVLKFITWNVDGLNEKNLMLRTKAVYKSILQEQADIVFLQEVVPESAEYFLTHLTDYHCLFGNDVGYFIGTLLKKSSISYKQFEIIKFSNTRMMRNALRVDVVYNKLPLCLFNSHLESTSDGAEERKVQLRLVFKEIFSTSDDCTVLFAGDLNLRDKEITEIGGLPAGIEDLWIACGRRKECSYTFDMTRNDNLVWNGRFKPRCRFDRAYVRHSSPRKLKPIYFGLIGLERLLPHRCFPSDHWGILCHFKME